MSPVPLLVGACGACGPTSPRGIVKLKVAALEDPEFVTLALLPCRPVVVVPTAMVAAAPGVPALPCAPVVPVAPTSPRGIEKSKTAALEFPLLVTVAEVPGAPVTVDPTAMVAAAPGNPGGPGVPDGPVILCPGG